MASGAGTTAGADAGVPAAPAAPVAPPAIPVEAARATAEAAQAAYAEAQAAYAQAGAVAAEARAFAAEARAAAAEARVAALEAGKAEAEARATAAEAAQAEAERALTDATALAQRLQQQLDAAAAGVRPPRGGFEEEKGHEGAGGKTEEGGGAAAPSFSYAGPHFQGSTILPRVAAGTVGGTAVDGWAALLAWLPAPHHTPDGKTWTLKFSGERDGWLPDEFHAACDGRGPTVVLVRGVAVDDGREFVAGGYAARAWASNGELVRDTKSARAEGRGSFLFSLVDAAGHCPVQLPLKDPVHGVALANISQCGPRFGVPHDLSVGEHGMPLNDEGGSRTVTSFKGSCYDATAAAAQGCTTFRGPGHPKAGERFYFTTKSLEVYELQ